MTTELIKFNYDEDLRNDQAPEFSHDKVTFQIINDTNAGNYSSGWINFLDRHGGASNKRWNDWSESYTGIPYTFTISLATATDGDYIFNVAKNFRYAIAPKPYIHFIDSVIGSFNQVPFTGSSEYQNFWMNEKLKTMNLDEQKFVGDMLNLSWDSGDTIDFSAANVGERNNEVFTQNDLTAAYNTFPNTGHLERCKRNLDLRNQTGSSIRKVARSSNLLNTNNQGGIISVTNTEIVYQNIAYIPLKYVSDFYAKLPTVQQTDSFSLQLLMNIDSVNSYTVTYDCYGNETKCEAQQYRGHTCPFMLSRVDLTDSTTSKQKDSYSYGGIPIIRKTGTADTTSFSITVKPSIGWGSNNIPARLYIKNVNMDPTMAKPLIAENGLSATLFYRDFTVEMDSGVNAVYGGLNVERSLKNTSRPRFLYIIPFLSSTKGTPFSLTAPFNSPLSSAPTTCSPFKISNFNCKIADSYIVDGYLNTPFDFYNSLASAVYAHVNGNSLKSKDFGTAINKTLWEQSGYGVYVVDLKTALTMTEDQEKKSIDVKFKIEAAPSVVYDIYYIIEHEKTLTVNRATGVVTTMV